MNAKKIITLITAIALVLSLAVVPVSATIDPTAVSFEIVDGTGIVGQDIDVVVKMTGSVSLFNLDLGYNTEYLTYVSAATCNATVTAAEEAGVVTFTRQETSALDLDGEVLATITFTALDREAFEALEVESVTAEFTFAPQQAPAGGGTFENDLYPGLGGIGFANEALSYDLGAIVISLPPTAPVATAVAVLDADGAALEAAPMVGETLTAYYEYDDVNGDVENTTSTAIQWYADGVAIEGATDAEYTLTAAEIGAVITVGVTPANDAEKGDEAVEAVSEEGTLAVAVNPALKATIVEDSLAIDPADKIRVGKPVTVSYELVSPNGGEDASIVVWSDEEGNELAGEISEDGFTFTPDNDDKNKVIKVTVTPKDSLTEANEEAVVALVAEVPVTKKSGSAPAFTGGTTLVDKEDKEEPGTETPGTETPVAGIEKFTDVDATVYAWAVEGIDALVKAGVIKGITDTTFEPETKTTRAHFVAMLIRAIGAVDETAESTYADVAKDYWGYAEIATAQKLGALAILGENFEPEKVITREEMASVLYEVAKAKGIALGEAATAEEFSDASSIAEGAAEAVTALQKAGIIAGMGDGTFAPKGETTRAQAAKVVYMVYKLA